MPRNPHPKALTAIAVILFVGHAFAQPAEAPQPTNERKTPTPEDLGDQTYTIPIVATESFQTVMERDVRDKPGVMRKQQTLLESRYDLSNLPSKVMMSGGRRAVQQGVRVKLPKGVTWEQLAAMKPEEIREKGLFPQGFLPLPHVKHAVGGQVFPKMEIDEIRRLEARSLQRFDVDFDIPEHLLPEFPPPIFLSQRPDLGDVSQGKVLSVRNFFELMNGKITPVQMDGLRQLLTPFPQAEFNATDSRKVTEGSFGVACLDCHTNGHTNGAIHLNPDNRPQAARFRLDTVSLRGVFNQQIHGSKRSLRSIEDFSEFEQRTAYFNGDIADAAKKGVNEPDRPTQVANMAQMQNMFDFPPAPKLLPTGRLDPALATEQERLGEKVFFEKGQCAVCHVPSMSFLDHQMHDLRVERFFKPRTINDQLIHADGPIKTFTLRGIKDSPPYFHDGRLLTLEDTVEFFNLVLGLRLEPREKDALVQYMRVL
ncbi:cytochrome B6 [Pyxidicoccus parkwayensis]|uniref:Cytochrome B6 n=1 Tax=Pyxidicoccus parkwayensis TaxID=2813578 RepID=A0ABX7NL89_9BACT|nr:cytochrome B6 [Pyxidicoccus parkwaysis]QSQ19617.1 cytochrome B6 [Pyxidicoccus parkwaysis]